MTLYTNCFIEAWSGHQVLHKLVECMPAWVHAITKAKAEMKMKYKDIPSMHISKLNFSPKNSNIFKLNAKWNYLD